MLKYGIKWKMLLILTIPEYSKELLFKHKKKIEKLFFTIYFTYWAKQKKNYDHFAYKKKKNIGIPLIIWKNLSYL